MSARAVIEGDADPDRPDKEKKAVGAVSTAIRPPDGSVEE
jgi:hypothetical protein